MPPDTLGCRALALKMTEHIQVKFLFRGQAPTDPGIWIRQFPGKEPVWGACRFVFDPLERTYDWLVVFDDLPRKPGQKKYSAQEELACPPEHTLFITREPSSVTAYGSVFLNQFNYVLTGQEDWAIHHPGKIHSQPALNWFYGLGKDHMLDFDQLTANPPENKTQTLSTVCSTKAQKHTQHGRRVKFIEKLQKALPELERFGKGVQAIDDKAEALDRFKYHIAIENHICDHWWTEKLSDAFLGLTLPFYCGAPNTADYFPAESFIPIDIRDVEGSLRTIRKAIQNNEYEKRLPAIREARRLVLEKYNTFAVLSKLIEERLTPAESTACGQIIHSKHALRKNPLHAFQIGLEKINMRCLNLIHKSD